MKEPRGNALPAWSPEGKRVPFVSDRDADFEADGNWGIGPVKVGGSILTALVKEPRRNALPAWSPEGERVAFVSDRDADFEAEADGH